MGFGFLQQMSETMKHNRDLLGRKKSVREIYKEEINKRATTLENQDLESLRLRVAARLKKDKTQDLIKRTIKNVVFAFLAIGVVWALKTIDFTPKSKDKYEDKSVLFNTKTYEQANGLILKSDYYFQGTKAADTYYKAGLKHQNLESYYQTGQQFRSALYDMDSLILDVYFYKSGDTIKNFPVIRDDRIHHITLINQEENKKIEFDYYDGKQIRGTYQETNLEK